MVIASDAMPNHCSFYFQGSGLPLSVSGSWSGSMYRAHHIALQDLQAITMMLCRMAFHLSGKALHLDNSTAKGYLCNHGGTCLLFFLDWPAGY